MPPQYIILNGRAKDIAGQRFGRLVALGPIGRANSQISWFCRCDCGNMTEVRVNMLISGRTQSCGCLRKEIARRRMTTHGMKKHILFSTWEHMVDRCTNPNNRFYGNYGGRGIVVCNEWLQSPQAFCEYASSLPDFGTKNYTLDRIDNSLGYFPGNMRWASKSQQQRNMRSNHLLTHDGKTMCISAWAEELGMKQTTLRARIYDGWSVERALMTPVKGR